MHLFNQLVNRTTLHVVHQHLVNETSFYFMHVSIVSQWTVIFGIVPSTVCQWTSMPRNCMDQSLGKSRQHDTLSIKKLLIRTSIQVMHVTNS